MPFARRSARSLAPKLIWPCDITDFSRERREMRNSLCLEEESRTICSTPGHRNQAEITQGASLEVVLGHAHRCVAPFPPERRKVRIVPRKGVPGLARGGHEQGAVGTAHVDQHAQARTMGRREGPSSVGSAGRGDVDRAAVTADLAHDVEEGAAAAEPNGTVDAP